MRRAVALLAVPFMVISGVSIATFVAAGPASAETPPAEFVIESTNFYAYATADETVDVDVMVAAPSQNSPSHSVLVTVLRPGASTLTCTIPAGDPANGTHCPELANLTAPQAGIWRVRVANDNSTYSPRVDWKINVQDGSTTIPGRVWTYQYNMSQYSQSPADFALYYVSDTGAQYKTTYRDFMGLESNFSADQIGLHSAGDCTSVDRSAVHHEPDQPVLGGCGNAYKIFFEKPDASMPTSATRWDGSTHWLLPDGPTDPSIQSLDYAWDGSATQSGTISYQTADFVGNLDLQVDIDGDGTVDRTIPVYSDGNADTFDFDGLDAQGDPISSTTPVTFTLAISKADEIHFVNYDVEERSGGIEVENLTTGSKTIYWDDRHMNTVNGTRCSDTAQLDGTAGVNSNGGVHGWPLCPDGENSNANTGTSGAWGDQSYIDDWTYRPVDVTRSVSSGPPTVSCATDPNIFNTGYDDSSGGVLADGASAPRWMVAGGYAGFGYPNGTTPMDQTSLPPAGASFVPAQVGKVNSAWASSPFNNAQWISADYVSPSNGQNQQGPQDPNDVQGPASADWYYRYQFILSPTVDPANFALNINFLADNSVAAVYVNGQPQTGTNLPQATPPFTPGTTDTPYDYLGFQLGSAAQLQLDQDWQPGLNTIIVQTKSYYTAEGFNAQMQSSTLCRKPDIEVSKSVDPASRSTVHGGDVLTYTLSFHNKGTATGSTDYVDYLNKVLDDATVTTAPTSSDADLSVSAVSGGQFEVSGSVPANETYTVTYQVTVNPAGQRGDDHLDNFVAPEGSNPPDECVANDPLCTSNPVGHLSIEKSASTTDRPAPGDTVSYTVVVTNDGAVTHTPADGPATDDLSDVLDDATYNNDADATSGTVDVTGNQLTWNGTLDPGDTVTITYSVTYTGDGSTVMTNTACVPAQGEDENCDTVSVPAADIHPRKSVDPASGTTVVAGQTLTYTLTFDNRGAGAGDVDYTDYQAGILDDATITSGPAASDPALTLTQGTGDALHITGIVPGNTSYTVTYTVTVLPDGQRGDNVLGNFLVEGNDPPPSDCDPASTLCTENPVPEVHVRKSVDPKSGSTAHAGDVLTYTLTFTNTGMATGTLDWVDHLADVLDDATLTGQPAASDADLSVGKLAKGDLPITGSIPAGASYTVAYQVRINPDGQRGNNSAANFLTRTGEKPPTHCRADDPLCTLNPIPEIHDWKTVAPTSGTGVVPGQTLTYTLHFANKGKAVGTLDRVDDITQAIDDATVASQPRSSDSALSVTTFGSDHRAKITGKLQPGQTVTVTYQLTVDDPDAGDGMVANFLQKPADPPPSSPQCTPADTQEPDCTANPVGSLKVSKTVDPKSSTQVHPGDTLTYTLHFSNVGAGPVPVDQIDHLANVLDDAEVSSQPTTSSDALSVSAASDQQFEVTGTLAAGESATVTYQVTTKPYDQQGDHDLVNFVDPPNVTPPTQCVQNDPLCTVNPVPAPTAPASELASTGNPTRAQLVIAGLLLAAGAVLALTGIRRRRAG